MSKNVITVVASVLLSGLTAFGISRAATPAAENASAQAVYPSDGSAYRTVNLSQVEYPDFTYAAESAVDAVVFVKVTVRGSQQDQMIDPFFRYFFGDGFEGRGREREGSGSGVIIRPDGYIVTNNHVVQNATKIEVTLNNNQTFEATVVGTDPATDVALIKIDAQALPTIEFGDSDQLRLGEWVLAIGSPLGETLSSTITAGIVSAKGRSMPSQDREFKIESFIQTDAAVNPGNSGGALVNKAGQLVGINTAIVSTTGSFSGYSFAIPSNIVSKVVGDLIDFGSVKRAMLGIAGGTVTAELADKLKLDKPEGVYVSEVVKGGAADKAGIKEEDVIVNIGGTPTHTMPELQAKVNSFHPGDKSTVTVLREGKTRDMQVEFTDGNVTLGTVAGDGTVADYGAQLRRGDNGVEIVSVGRGKMQEAGAQAGMVIRFVNDQKVKTPQDVIDITKKSKRAIFIEGVTPNGRSFYFGFGKDE